MSSLLDYGVGLGLESRRGKVERRILLITSLSFNLGMLIFFKYFNFFAESFQQAFTLFGHPMGDPFLLDVVLPVGISFYTFQTLSYSIDVHQRKIPACKDPIAFFAFVSFFPQLVAGPIERAKSLLPQFERVRHFDVDCARDGLRQVLWGAFKKIVIADKCAEVVNLIFEDPSQQSGSALLVGAILFSIQIYGDFSGYSDMALGTARLLGFRLMKNFAFPYFSRDIAEFWRRWHISLSTWFRDYVYIPLGGSRGGRSATLRNTLVVFCVSGMWHGANWTFLIWGLLHACLFLPSLLLKRNRRHLDSVAQGRCLPSPMEAWNVLATFVAVSCAWIFFRSETLSDAMVYFSGMLSSSLFTLPGLLSWETLFFLTIFMVVEWIQREKDHGLEIEDRKLPVPLRWAIYLALIAAVNLYGGRPQEFVYFQF